MDGKMKSAFVYFAVIEVDFSSFFTKNQAPRLTMKPACDRIKLAIFGRYRNGL